jgi:hypothetical protein
MGEKREAEAWVFSLEREEALSLSPQSSSASLHLEQLTAVLLPLDDRLNNCTMAKSHAVATAPEYIKAAPSKNLTTLHPLLTLPRIVARR